MTEPPNRSALSPAARVFAQLEPGEEALLTTPSPGRRAWALALALLLLAAVPLFYAANASGVIGDVPSALAKGQNSGPGAGLADDDDDRSGPGGDDDDDDRTFLKTDDTSGNKFSTRGTTRDGDTLTNTRGGTNDTSRNNQSTRGTTRDNDTRSNTRNSATGTQTRTRTRTG